MEHDFWHQRWESDRIGFHLSEVNEYLKTHWAALGVGVDEQVLVPLCGKSLDLGWLAQRHAVLGIELSQRACEAYFAEAGWVVQPYQQGDFQVFKHEQLTLLCGDFFALEPAQLAHVGVVYDRAALIALPPKLRRQYAQKLSAQLPLGVKMLLVTLTFDVPDGPPFSVTEQELQGLFGERFNIRCLASHTLTDPRDAGRTEHVYCLEDRA